MAKRILRHVHLGISFLQSHGVIHGGFHKGNIFFRALSLDSCIAEELEEDANAGIMSVIRLDGRFDKWAPRYLTTSRWYVMDLFPLSKSPI